MATPIKLNVTEDEGTRLVTLKVSGVPDITPEESCLKHVVRPEALVLEYISEGLNPWVLHKVTASGRLVNVHTGEVSRTTMRRHFSSWTDLKGTGQVHKAVTPKWVVQLAEKFPTPEELPRKR